MATTTGPLFVNVEYVFYKLYNFILAILVVLSGGGLKALWGGYLRGWWFASLFLSLLFLVFSFYFISKTLKFRREEDERFFGKEGEKPVEAQPLAVKSKEWEDVTVHLNSDNPANWKLAIIEADKMLDEALSAMGYVGLSLGDKLKAVQPGFLQTLDDAWAAHKVRNQIAHETNFELSEREARLTISRYEKVFKELDLI